MGEARIPFVLDTGATSTVVSNELADALALPQGEKQDGRGAAGKMTERRGFQYRAKRYRLLSRGSALEPEKAEVDQDEATGQFVGTPGNNCDCGGYLDGTNETFVCGDMEIESGKIEV
jgi:hypothetical protein